MRTPDTLIDALPAHFALLDQAGLICRVNRAWRDFAERNGVSAQSVGVGCDYLAVCDAATDADKVDGVSVAKGIRAVLRGEAEQFVLEYPCHSPGIERWFRLEASPAILDGVRHAVVMHHNVTELHQVDEALRSSEQQRLRILEMADDAIMAVDEDQKIVIFNRGAEKTFGYAAAEVLGKPLDLLLPERFRISHRTQVKDFGASGVPSRPMGYRNLISGLHKDGHEFPAESSIGQFIQGGKRFYTAVVRDVSKRLEAERKLKESEERLRAVVESAPAYFVILDSRATVLFINRSDSPAHTRDQLVGMEMLQFLEPEFQAPARDALSRVFERGDVVNLKVSARRSDNSIQWYAVRVGPIAWTGNSISAIWVATNVTEQQLLEEQFRQAQKMESVGRLAGGVAHDFNNLLTAIMGHAELIAARPGSPSDAEHARQILESSRRAADLTRQLLAYSRKQGLRPRRINLNDVIAESLKLLSRLIGEDISLTTKLASDLRGVLADPSQIGQVLMNLAVNARDAMPRGGVLTIETRNTVIRPEHSGAEGVTAGAYVQLEVSDTGMGMSPETLARVFEPFFTTKPLGQGTGLGLAMVDGIVRQSGGQIFVTSEPGRGSTFLLFFPVVSGAAEPVKRPSAPIPRAGGLERILLVEDDTAVRLLAGNVLSDHGYEIVAASSPAEALKLCAENHKAFDLLLTDVVMPGIGGLALAKELLRRFPTLKVLFVSGYTDKDVLDHSVLGKGTGFLQKPFKIDQLAAKVREVLDSVEG